MPTQVSKTRMNGRHCDGQLRRRHSSWLVVAFCIFSRLSLQCRNSQLFRQIESDSKSWRDGSAGAKRVLWLQTILTAYSDDSIGDQPIDSNGFNRRLIKVDAIESGPWAVVGPSLDVAISAHRW